MDDAAAFTLEVEFYLTLPVRLTPSEQQVSAVSEGPESENNPSVASVAAIHTQHGETL